MVYRFFVHGGKQRSIKEPAGLVQKDPKMIRESTSENSSAKVPTVQKVQSKNKIKREERDE